MLQAASSGAFGGLVTRLLSLAVERFNSALQSDPLNPQLSREGGWLLSLSSAMQHFADQRAARLARTRLRGRREEALKNNAKADEVFLNLATESLAFVRTCETRTRGG